MGDIIGVRRYLQGGFFIFGACCRALNTNLLDRISDSGSSMANGSMALDCASVHGRSNVRTMDPPHFCYQLSLSIAGGCDSYFTRNEVNGKTKLCLNGTDGSCTQSDFFFCSPPSAPPSIPPSAPPPSSPPWTCQDLSNRVNVNSLPPAQYCSDLLVNVTGGCEAYYFVNELNRFRLCSTALAEGGHCGRMSGLDCYPIPPPSPPPPAPPSEPQPSSPPPATLPLVTVELLTLHSGGGGGGVSSSISSTALPLRLSGRAAEPARDASADARAGSPIQWRYRWTLRQLTPIAGLLTLPRAVANAALSSRNLVIEPGELVSIGGSATLVGLPAGGYSASLEAAPASAFADAETAEAEDAVWVAAGGWGTAHFQLRAPPYAGLLTVQPAEGGTAWSTGFELEVMGASDVGSGGDTGDATYTYAFWCAPESTATAGSAVLMVDEVARIPLSVSGGDASLSSVLLPSGALVLGCTVCDLYGGCNVSVLGSSLQVAPSLLSAAEQAAELDDLASALEASPNAELALQAVLRASSLAASGGGGATEASSVLTTLRRVGGSGGLQSTEGVVATASVLSAVSSRASVGEAASDAGREAGVQALALADEVMASIRSGMIPAGSAAVTGALRDTGGALANTLASSQAALSTGGEPEAVRRRANENGETSPSPTAAIATYLDHVAVRIRASNP